MLLRTRSAAAGRRRGPVSALCVLALCAGLPGAPAAGHAAGPVAGPAADPWDGTRAELFLTNINQPTLVAGQAAGAAAAILVNRGPSSATNVRFTYTVPAGLTYVAAKVASTACTYAAPIVTCALASLANAAQAPVTVQLSAPAATTPGVLTGSFSPVTSDQYNPAGGNLLRQTRIPGWIGNNQGQSVAGPWPPSNPYAAETDLAPTSTAPCVPYTNFNDVYVSCAGATTSRAVIAASERQFCYQQDDGHPCLRTWEIMGTYYAPASGNVHLCVDTPDDGVYLNWSNAYDPASGSPTTFTNAGEAVDWVDGVWTSGNVPVQAHMAYRFSIRVANRDTPTTREQNAGGYDGIGFTAVGGGACAFGNFAPPQPARVTVAAAGGGWDGSRAELFVVGVSQPTLTAGGQPGAVTATLVNRGPNAAPATNVQFRYSVPTGLSATAATVGGGACPIAGSTVTCTVASLALDATLPVSVTLSAPAGTAPGVKPGTFSPVTADQFTPAGGELLMRTRTPDWIGNDANQTPTVWAPSNPFPASTAPCAGFTDWWQIDRICPPGTVTNAVVSTGPTASCTGLNDGQSCIRTWELIGTYYAQADGAVRLCLDYPDDGAYVNWSDPYNPASGSPVNFHSVAQTNYVAGRWVSGTWPVAAGSAYRFSIRVANRDYSYNRGRESGGFAGLGLSTVGGDGGTCAYANFTPAQPANATVITATLSITAPTSSNLGTVAVGATHGASLGAVTVNNPGGLLTWTATVSATGFSNGTTTLPATRVSYWSGTATTTGSPGTYTPGQPSAGAAVTLNVTRTAYQLTAGQGANTATWHPTVIIDVPLTATSGVYSGVITHSVA